MISFTNTLMGSTCGNSVVLVHCFIDLNRVFLYNGSWLGVVTETVCLLFCYNVWCYGFEL